MKKLISFFIIFLSFLISLINSSTLNFGTDIGYSSEKVLATIGQGNIVIKDKDNSDDVTNLNRDTDNQINKLYEGSVGTNVEASIDHRLFTEEGRKDIARDFEVVADKFDDLSRYIKDKIGGYELTDELKSKAEKNKVEALREALANEGVSEEKIAEVLANEKVQTLLLGYQESPQEDTKDGTLNAGEAKPIIVASGKDLQNYMLDGAEGIKAIVDIVGEDKAATGILVAQFVFQGTIRTVTSLAGDEVKDFIFGGLKETTSDFLADTYFDINNKQEWYYEDSYNILAGYNLESEQWSPEQQATIKTLTDMTADFTIDTLISGGVFGIIKKAGKLSDVQASTDNALHVGAKKSNVAIQASEKNFKIVNDKWLKQNGIDAHELKSQFVGKTNISKYDLYKDTKTNEVLILRKGGKGETINTGIFIK